MANRIQGITVEIGGDTTRLTTALKGVNSEIRNTQSQLKNVEKLLKLDPHNSELLAQKQRLLTEAIGETKEKLEALKSAQQQFENAVTSAGKKLLPVTARITAAGGASAKMAMDFEDAISAGQKTGDAVNFVSNSTKLAMAGFSDAGSALDVLTTIMNAYGLEVSEVGRVSDVLIQTENLGKTTVGELSSSMGKIIPTEKANGVALEQVAAGYALMTANGVATAEAGKAGLILLGDSAETFNGTLEQMQNSTGATETAFGKLNTNSYTIQKAFNQLKNTAIEFGSAIMSVLAPVLVALADKIQAFTSWFSRLSEGTKKMIVIIAMVVAAVGPVLIIIGKIATGISAVMSLMGVITPAISALIPVIASVGAPILAIIAVIVAVIAVGKLLVAHWDEIKAACINIWNAVKEFFAGLCEGIKQTASAAWTAISQFFPRSGRGYPRRHRISGTGLPHFSSRYGRALKLCFRLC